METHPIRRPATVWPIVVVASVLLAAAGSSFADPVDPPGNVIVVILDDVSIDELDVYGSHGFPLGDTVCDQPCTCPDGTECSTCDCTVRADYPNTPFISSLASNGVVFRNAYANPWCSTTRATMLTGRYSYRTGVGHATSNLGPRELTIPEVLDDFASAYSTAAIGKWHISNNAQCGNCGPVSSVGFDYFAGAEATSAGPSDYCSWSKFVIPREPETFPPSCSSTGQRHIYATSDQVDDAIRWICQESCGDGLCDSSDDEDIASCPQDCEEQYNCGVNGCKGAENHFNCPNDCTTAPVCDPTPNELDTCDPGEYHCTCDPDKSQPSTMRCEADCPNGFPFPEPQCTPRTENWFMWLAFNAPHTEHHVACGDEEGCQSDGSPPCGKLGTARDTVHCMIELIDCELRRLERALDFADLLDNTTFIVVGDNGTAGAASHWPGGHTKGSVYEGGVRVPLIVSGPDVMSGGRQSDALVNTTDVFATALELMGVDVDQDLAGVDLDSESFLPILQDPTGSNARTTAYVEDFRPDCSVTTVWERAVRDDQYKLIQHCKGLNGAGGRCYEAPANCSGVEEIYAVSDVRECCNLKGNTAAEDHVDQFLRPHLPDDVECRAGDPCTGCCDNAHCTLPDTCVRHVHECCSDPAACCPDPSTYEGIRVTWLGPGGEPMDGPDEDYEVFSDIVGSECLPHVELYTTQVSETNVLRYTIGRVDGNNDPLPIGTVSADWVAGTNAGIAVEVGAVNEPLQQVGAVDVIDVPSVAGEQWSGIILDVSGDVTSLVQATPVAGIGGRVEGTVDGKVNDVVADAIGSGDSGGGELRAGGLTSGGTLDLDKHESISTLKIVGPGSAIADVVVADSINGIQGPVLITETFDGKLCGANLVGGIPGHVDVAFGSTGQVCDETCNNCVTPCLDEAAVDAPTAEPDPVVKNRFLSFKVPDHDVDYAIRVLIDVVPDLPNFEGKVLWVNSFKDGVGEPDLTCPDPPSEYFCATLGCDPEARNWDEEVVTGVLHVTGPDIVPDSRYVVQAYVDGGTEYDCRSAAVVVETARWGDVVGPSNGPPDGVANVLDIGAMVDKLKGLATAGIAPRFYLRDQVPAPDAGSINVLDVGFTVDATKGIPYPFAGPCCCPEWGETCSAQTTTCPVLDACERCAP